MYTNNKQRLLYYIFIYYIFASTAVANISKNVYKLFEIPAEFSAESTLFLNEVDGIDKEAGFKIKSKLEIEPVWRKGDEEFLLKLQITNAKIWIRKLARNAEFMPHQSILDKITLTPFLVHWKSGVVVDTYMGDEDVHVVNYKKSLAGLFQFQTEEGKRNETDASGTCDVIYETMSVISIRKIKYNCKWPELESELLDTIKSDIITLYTFSNDGQHLNEIFADEVHRVRVSSTPTAPGVKARGWVQLTRVNTGVKKVKLIEDFDSALEKWGPLKKGSVALSLVEEENPPEESLANIIKSVHEDLLHICEVREDDIGNVEEEMRRQDMVQSEAIAGAKAILLLAQAFQSPTLTASNVQKVLEDEDNSDILWGVLAGAGASGSSVALAGVLRALKPDAPRHRQLMRDYLTILATSSDVDDATVQALLLVRRSAWDAGTQQEALLAVAAASTGPRVSAQTASVVWDTISKSLSRCGDRDCRAAHLRAVGNLRRRDTVPLLLQAAETGEESLDALDALSSCPPTALRPQDLARLAHIVMSPRPIDTRAAALHVALTAEAVQGKTFLDFPIAEVAIHLEKFGPMELKRLFWQMLEALEEQHASLLGTRYFLRTGYNELKSWHARAHGGLSSALSRTVSSPYTNASLWSLQAVSGGALRRSLVVLHTHSPTLPVLTVEVRTTGLESLSDKAPAREGEAPLSEPLGAALYVSGGGARARGAVLFAGQAELLGHVWSGAAASRVRAAARAQAGVGAARRGSVTGAVLAARTALASLLDLTAQAQVSLWNRVADAKLNLQSGVWGSAALGAAGWCGVAVRAQAGGAPALTVRAVIDFYDDVKLCVAVNTHRAVLTHNITKTEAVSGGTHRTLRVHHTETPLDGVTLGLDPQNNRGCRDMI